MDKLQEYEQKKDQLEDKFELLSKEYNALRHADDYRGFGWEFDVKLHNVVMPHDLRELFKLYPDLENESIDIFEDFIAIKADDLVSDLQRTFNWIGEGFQVGRGSGWLVLIDRDYENYEYNMSEIVNNIYYNDFEEADNAFLDCYSYVNDRAAELKTIKSYIHEYIGNLGDWFYGYLKEKGIIKDYTGE